METSINFTTGSHFNASAYGGQGWSPRTDSLGQELGRLWGACGVTTEWSALKAVLLHRPGPELENIGNPDAIQMLAWLDFGRAREQHEAMARAYREAGVVVHYVEPPQTPPPNQMFVADLMFMTPEGAIVGRPASTVRAGEERWVARRLADLGVPILRTIRGHGVFEGADAAWLDPQTVLLATGLRTNSEGAAQVSGLLRELGIEVIQVGLPYGSMHLMGTLRFADRGLALAWPGRAPYAAVEALRRRGYTVLFLPDNLAAMPPAAFNFVTLGPGRILLPASYPAAEAFYREAGLECVTVEVDELTKAAGAIGCMSGIVAREIPAT